MIPYCICLFDGKLKYSFYLTDYKSSEDMIKAFINLLFTKTITVVDKVKVFDYKYNGYLVYAQNFSRFDSIFILKLLIKHAYSNGFTVDILKRDSDFINISIKIN